MSNFWEGFEKRAEEHSGWSDTAEIAGLGTLAYPSYRHLTGNHMKPKGVHKLELAGLGILAAPSAYRAGKWAVNKLKGSPKPAES